MMQLSLFKEEEIPQPNIEVVDIDSLVADDQNFNRGTDEGKQLIARSFKEHGAGLSVYFPLRAVELNLPAKREAADSELARLSTYGAQET